MLGCHGNPITTTAVAAVPVIMANNLTTTTTVASSNTNATSDHTLLDGSPWQNYVNNTGMMKRGMYVLLSFGLIVVLYFGIKTYRTRNRPARTYGLLASRGETIELNPLESDSDEDCTVFEAKSLQY